MAWSCVCAGETDDDKRRPPKSVAIPNVMLSKTRGPTLKSCCRNKMRRAPLRQANGLDFLSQLTLAEHRDDQHATEVNRQLQRSRRKLSFHPQLVTSVRPAPEGVDWRRPGPSLANGGGTDYSPEEERAAMTKQIIKEFRTRIGKVDPEARRQFNEAWAAEARLRAAQASEVNRREQQQAGRGGSAAAAAAEKQMVDRHYEELLAMQQRANAKYRLPTPPPPPPQQQQDPQQYLPQHYQQQQQNFMQQRAAMQRQHHTSTRVVAPPGGMSSVVLG